MNEKKMQMHRVMVLTNAVLERIHLKVRKVLRTILLPPIRLTIINSNLQDNYSLILHNLGYDCCSLTLQPCRTPLVSPAGWLFDKEALLKYIIEKKQEYARKLKEYERQKDRDLKVFYIQFPRKNLCNVKLSFFSCLKLPTIEYMIFL